MTSEKQTVKSIMIPISGFPCLKESGTVREAIYQLRSFCPIGSMGPCGFSELMVVDDQGMLAGKVTQQGVLRVLFSSLLAGVDVKSFKGMIPEQSDLATLLGGVLIQEGVNDLEASLTRVIERDVRTVSPETDLLHAMSIMVLCRETLLPVTEAGQLLGIVKLTEVFGALGDMILEVDSH